jgi:hypothetical protein
MPTKVERENYSQEERENGAGGADQKRSATVSSELTHVQPQPYQEDEDHHYERIDGKEPGGNRGREQSAVSTRGNHSQTSRPKGDAGNHFANHSRLAQKVKEIASCFGYSNQDCQLRKKKTIAHDRAVLPRIKTGVSIGEK